MTSDALSMTFAAMFRAQVEATDLLVPRLRDNFYIACPSRFPVKAALSDKGDDPARRQLVVRNNASTDGTTKDDKRPKYASGHPRKVDLVIYNTERMPHGYMKGLLQRVFHESSPDALILSLQRHIHEGPYTREAALMKAAQVRQDAAMRNIPIPCIRYERAKRL